MVTSYDYSFKNSNIYPFLLDVSMVLNFKKIMIHRCHIDSRMSVSDFC